MENNHTVNSQSGGKVLAMYDIRGIQDYIYRTPHIKDAMGASLIIEDILKNALREACKNLKLKPEETDLEWEKGEEEEEVKPFKMSEKAVQVLYIGGGNAYVIYNGNDLYRNINKIMSKYIIEHTYSLQLAAACVKVTDKYYNDYEELRNKMDDVKAKMAGSKPLGALPIMKTEIRTGYPAIEESPDKNRVDISKETAIKLDEKNEKIKELKQDKFLENYINRGKDSRIAVVHIDGNNMGLRIREQIEHEPDYVKAVNTMRQISHNIKKAYNDTFDKMKHEFEDEDTKFAQNIERFVRKVIVAGDDITYVCNAHIALETVRYYSEQISGLMMVSEESTQENIEKYGFSICAGIAYIGSHFPFYTAYEVAEACCASAKGEAKKDENKEKLQPKGERIGNYVDFQICKNIHCKNLDKVRQEEYSTPTGENLLIRPYYIPTTHQYGLSKNAGKINDYTSLKENIRKFSDEKNLPRSFVKDIRNTYSLGRYQMDTLYAFLKSRDWKLPKDSLYEEINGVQTALWYDAAEIMDYNLYITQSQEENADA